MQQQPVGISHTFGVKLMVMQAELLAERNRANPRDWNAAFDQLMHGPDAQLLSSIWTRSQRHEFQRFMQQERLRIERRAALH